MFSVVGRIVQIKKVDEMMEEAIDAADRFSNCKATAYAHQCDKSQ